MHKRARIVGAIMLVAALSGLPSCTASYQNHGYAPSASELSAIKVGVDTRETVTTAIGRPTAESLVGEGEWYYVQSRFRHYGFFEPKEVEREVLVLSFNAAGKVANIERFGLADGRVIVLERRVTQETVRDTTFIRQLLGNIGRVTAGQLLGQT